MSPKRALATAVRLTGGQTALAKAIGGKVRQAHVWNWLNVSGKAPSRYCKAIRKATGGKVSLYALRPDVYEKSDDVTA